MQLFTFLLGYLVAITLSAPTTKVSSRTLIPRDIADVATRCSKGSSAMVNAIGKLCGGLDGPLIVGSSTITYESDNAYGNAPHPAAIQISGTCGDFEDVSDICMSAGYTLCTAAVNLGTGVKLNLGKDGRQRWAVAGYRPDGWMGMGFKWDDLMAIDKFVEVLPNDVCAREGGVKLKAGEGLSERYNNGDYKPYPAWASLTSICDADSDLTDDCMGNFWRLYAASIRNDFDGARLSTGKNGCEKWAIVGNGGNSFDWSRMVTMD